MSSFRVCRHMVEMTNERCEPQISRSLCKNLFGPIDHERLNNDLQTELSKIVEEKSMKYNFDFIKFTPLYGKFVWERINDTKTVTMTSSGTDTKCNNTDTATATTTATTTTNLPASVSLSTNHLAASAVSEPCMRTPERTPHRRSTRITDHLRRKKPSVSRQIKFNISANNRQSPKRVRTSKSSHRGCTTKQSTLEEFLPKLRPRHANKKSC